MDIRPIKTKTDYEAALKEIEALFDSKPGSHEADRLDILATLIEVYEDRHFPIEAPDPISAIKFRMEQQGLTRKDLEPYIGSRARVSEVLSGQRTLTLAMIRRLHRELKLPLESLICERKLGKKKQAKPGKHHSMRE